MKLLFNKEVDDSSELLAISGLNDASISISHLWPYIRTATRELVNIIGKDNYEKAVDFYDADAFDEEFLELVRYPLVLDAFRKYAPLTDIKFTDNGRQFRADDHHKAPWEWQVDKSDAQMEKAYYAAVDELISFITESEDYDSSEYMLQFTGLYVPNLRVFQEFVHINNSHLLYYKLAPSMRYFEETVIINRVGDKFTEYKTQNNSRIKKLIQNACVHYAMADGIKKLSNQLFPEGLMKSERTGKKAANGYDVESTVLYYDRILDSVLLSLEQEIRKTKTVYVPRKIINFEDNDGFVSM
ncbi:DUF6712 family protein [Chryseobacterium sp. Hurlbut01]|uniref:DUF6712 family protein n=1 Tax=Chryseobacterium sp. Hurlbut01 TaxID=1681828 RepID=UPI00067CF5A8|nr:DUF6712 family protein [Chryseobacterium sp. Hurlbut01]KNB60982.1 hypothetical protein AC804_17720 [Chryseobacterium sp. Hurlbut01]